jgi:hypothetical protein
MDSNQLQILIAGGLTALALLTLVVDRGPLPGPKRPYTPEGANRARAALRLKHYRELKALYAAFGIVPGQDTTPVSRSVDAYRRRHRLEWIALEEAIRCDLGDEVVARG